MYDVKLFLIPVELHIFEHQVSQFCSGHLQTYLDPHRTLQAVVPLVWILRAPGPQHLLGLMVEPPQSMEAVKDLLESQRAGRSSFCGKTETVWLLPRSRRDMPVAGSPGERDPSSASCQRGCEDAISNSPVPFFRDVNAVRGDLSLTFSPGIWDRNVFLHCSVFLGDEWSFNTNGQSSNVPFFIQSVNAQSTIPPPALV